MSPCRVPSRVLPQAGDMRAGMSVEVRRLVGMAGESGCRECCGRKKARGQRQYYTHGIVPRYRLTFAGPRQPAWRGPPSPGSFTKRRNHAGYELFRARRNFLLHRRENLSNEIERSARQGCRCAMVSRALCAGGLLRSGQREREPRIGGATRSLRQTKLPAHHVGAEHHCVHLVHRVAAAHAFASHAAIG